MPWTPRRIKGVIRQPECLRSRDMPLPLGSTMHRTTAFSWMASSPISLTPAITFALRVEF
jgi:hypothetical protein